MRFSRVNFGVCCVVSILIYIRIVETKSDGLKTRPKHDSLNSKKCDAFSYFEYWRCHQRRVYLLIRQNRLKTESARSTGSHQSIQSDQPITAEWQSNYKQHQERQRRPHQEQRPQQQQPFLVYWNTVTSQCLFRYGVDMNLDKYGIRHNTEGTHHGQEINTFYANRFGYFPRLEKNGDSVNGGLPQLANISQHLELVRKDIERYIPDRNFSGLGVIDFEYWRPIFTRNWATLNKYRKYSKKMVATQHPSWNTTLIQQTARREFRKAARLILKKTLELCKHLCPRAKWGYFLYPECYNYKPGQNFCVSKRMKENNRLSWLFGKSTSIYPSLYINQRGLKPHYRRLHAMGALREAYRIQRQFTRPYTPVMPFVRYRYTDTKYFYSMNDLDNTIGQAARSGSDGVVIWGTMLNLRSYRECHYLRKYVTTVLGPYVNKIMSFTRRCSEGRCNNHGRCVLKSWPGKKLKWTVRSHSRRARRKIRVLLRNVFHVNNNSKRRTNVNGSYHKQKNIYSFYRYRCQCYEGWSGNACDLRTHVPLSV